MRKLFEFEFVFSFILILFINKTAFGSSITVISENPGVQKVGIDNLLCYMQTEDGRILNLNNLCGKQIRDIVLLCPTITDPQVRARIVEYCAGNGTCLTSAGCKQTPRY